MECSPLKKGHPGLPVPKFLFRFLINFGLVNYCTDQRWLKDVEDKDVVSHLSQNRWFISLFFAFNRSVNAFDFCKLIVRGIMTNPSPELKNLEPSVLFNWANRPGMCVKVCSLYYRHVETRGNERR